MVKAYLGMMRQKFRDLSLDILIPIFILSFVLEFTHFFPDLRQINIWDEATYIHKGYLLLTQGIWPQLVDSPLLSTLYALTLWPVIHSPDFFVLSNAIARILLFALIFISTCLIAKELKPYSNPWIMVALIVIVPVAATMYLFPSDVLFAGFSGLAFWQMLAFYNHRDQKHLWWASVLMGIGTLARVEGLLLTLGMLIVSLIIHQSNKDRLKGAWAVLIPFILLVGGYILAHGLITGDFSTGLQGRTFNNFESGHEVIYSQTGIYTATISARLESREAFGTPEENDYSVFKAIARNPSVYIARLKRAIPIFVNFAIKAYGNKFILIFIWLSLRGIIDLTQKKHFALVLLGLLWFVPLGVGFLNTFFREGYFMMPYFVVFAFSSVGLTAIFENIDQKRERIGIAVASMLVIAISLLARNTSMLYRSSLFIFGLGFILILRYRIKDPLRWRRAALWWLLAIVLIMRGGFPSPEWPSYGNSDLERSVYFLQDNLPVGSKVLAGAPANVWAARMTYFGINSYDIPEFYDQEEFIGWIQAQGIDAVYIDLHFPEVYEVLAASASGDGLEEVYTTPERDIIIYLVNER